MKGDFTKEGDSKSMRELEREGQEGDSLHT